MPHLLSAWWQETSLSLASPAVEPERTVESRLAWGMTRVSMKSQRSAGEQALPVLRMSMPVSPYSAGEQPALAVVRCSRCRRAGVVVARKPRRRRSRYRSRSIVMLLLGWPNCLWQRWLSCHPRWRTGGDREDPVRRRGPARAERSAGRGRLAGVSPLSRSVVHHQLVVARLVEVAGWQSTRSDVHLIVETECWPTPMAAGAAWWPRLIPLGPVPISSGSVAVGDRFLSGPAVPAAPPPPVPVVPFSGGLNWWTRRWS